MKRSFSQRQGSRPKEFFEAEQPPRRLPAGEIVFADAHLIVVAKAPGAWAEPGLEDESGVAPLLVEAGYFQDEAEVQPIYPVDPPISGLVLYARDEQTREIMLRQVATDELVLRCMGIVRGHLLEGQGIIEGDPPARLKVGPVLSLLSSRSARAATHWTLRDSFVGFALLDCQPLPPLPGLVRVHLESAGIPLAVDSLHGGGQHLMLSSFKAGYRKSQRREERALIARVSLHAASVTFLHPATRQAMHCEAPLPKDMKAALHQLDRFGRI